jgi:hypothetical protein
MGAFAFNPRWTIAAGSCLAVALVAMAALAPNRAVSQPEAAASDVKINVSYSSRYINQIVPNRRNEIIRDVFPVPDSPALIVRTDKAFTVWERTENGIRSLIEIPALEGTNTLKFLDDGRTFVIENKASVRLYSLDKLVTYTNTKPKK